MTTPTHNALEGLHGKRIADVALDALRPFFDEPKHATWQACAAVWLLGLTTASGTPYRASVELEGFLDAQGAEARLPSRRAISRSLNLPLATDIEDPVRSSFASMTKITEAYTREQIALLNGVIRHLRWRSEDLYVTIDGRDLPFYGNGSNTVSRTLDMVDHVTSSGRVTSPAFRGKKHSLGDKGRITTPEFRGTLQASKWLHLTVHHWRSKESFPLVTLYRGRELSKDVHTALQALNLVRVAPQVILFDKEFTGSYKILDVVREYADPRGVYAIGPMAATTRIVKNLQDAWDNEDAAFVPDARETLYHYSTPYSSRSDPRGGHEIVMTYTLDERRPDAAKDQPASLVYQDREAGIGIRGMAFYCNRPVAVENAEWFASVYRRRWACESLFMRHVTLMGRSQSQFADTRHFAYATTFHLLALYGAWRSLQTPTATGAYPRERSHTYFLGALRGGLLSHLTKAPDQLTTPLTA